MATTQHTVSRERFYTEVQRTAYTIWQTREYPRRYRNWMQAIRELEYKEPVFPGDPRWQTIRTRAEQIYEAYKEADALADWQAAVQQVLTYYRIA